MLVSVKRIACFIVALAAASAAQAEPLRDPSVPACTSVDDDYAAGAPQMSANCSAPLVDGQHPRLDILVTAARGPVRIGDFAIDDAYLYNGSFTPEVWSVDPGDVLAVSLANGLSGEAGLRTNLHTHGLIVSPGNGPETPQALLGDNVYVAVTGAGTDPHHHDHATPKPGDVPLRVFDKTAIYAIPVPADHPKGLFWYHPHAHGIAGTQVRGGLSGFLTVGQASDYVAFGAKGGDVDERLLMLKDLQVEKKKDGDHWRIDRHYDSGNCDDKATKSPGVCSKDADHAWLFPVNGQIFPTIEIGGAAGQLWRIGNIGANVTYDLELVLVAEGKEERLPFQVVSIDGVAVGRGNGDQPMLRDHLLMMPSSRIEVLVAHPGKAGETRKAILRTAGFGTGATPEDGDHWPRIDLAEVVFKTSLAEADADAGFALVEDGGGAITLKQPASTRSDAACPPLGAGETRLVAFDIPSFPDGEKPNVDFAVPPGCRADQEYDIIGNTVARLADDSSFAAILSAYDHAVGEKYAAPLNGTPTPYRGKCFDGALDTCVAYPAVEEWWVVNASSEAHNFHIHQTRFQVLAVRGARSAFTPASAIYVDNYPVLAGQAIKVRIPFTRPEQIGTFVYHCHILEHEDNGMMAAIEVRDER